MVGTLLRRFAGIGIDRTGHIEKGLSVVGGLMGLLAVIHICQQQLGLGAGAGLVASMGATAVLLFGVPHGPLSQPWPVFGGHLISAVVGVACAKLLSQPVLGAGLAVALAIGAMHYLRCIHPPGGATALSAVIGGESVHQLGFQFVLTPVLLNVLILLSIALVFNYPFAWRRYPVALSNWGRPAPAPDEHRPPAEAADAIEAPRSKQNLDTDESRLPLAGAESEVTVRSPGVIDVGRCYSNGANGADWQVRCVLKRLPDADPAGSKCRLNYEIVAGNGLYRRGTSSCEDFARWARCEVTLDQDSGQRAIAELRRLTIGAAVRPDRRRA